MGALGCWLLMQVLISLLICIMQESFCPFTPTLDNCQVVI